MAMHQIAILTAENKLFFAFCTYCPSRHIDCPARHIGPDRNRPGPRPPSQSILRETATDRRQSVRGWSDTGCQSCGRRPVSPNCAKSAKKQAFAQKCIAAPCR